MATAANPAPDPGTTEPTEAAPGARWKELAWILPPAVIIACHTLQNNDLPLHLAIGEWVLAHGSVPASDPFSGNAPDQGWVPHEWLAGVFFAVVHRFAGAVGLVGLAMTLAGLLAILHRSVTAHLGISLHGHLWASLPMWLMAGRRLMLRPHLIALVLFFAVWWVLLRGRKQPLLLWLLPVLIATWANVHGSFLIGFGIVLADLALCGRAHRASRALRGALVGCSSVALLCTPYGFDGLLFPFRLTGNEVFMTQIAEWAPPFGSVVASELFRSTPAFALSCVWLVLLLPGLFRTKAVPVTYALFVLGSLILYLRHQRYLALFVLASHPLLVAGTGSLLAALAKPWRTRLNDWGAPASVVVISLLLIYPGYPVTWTDCRRAPQGTGLYLWGSNLPLWEVEQLVERGYHGLVLCEYDYGGVVSWKGQGRLQPSMDSRNTVYGAARFTEHQAQLARGDSPLLERAVAALIRSPGQGAPRAALHRRLEDHPAWALVSFTPRTYLYVRAGQGELDSEVFRLVHPATGRLRRPQPGFEPTLVAELDRAARMGWAPSTEGMQALKSWGIRWPAP